MVDRNKTCQTVPYFLVIVVLSVALAFGNIKDAELSGIQPREGLDVQFYHGNSRASHLHVFISTGTHDGIRF